jgi:Ala-tRNA(Pro) deacylase
MDEDLKTYLEKYDINYKLHTHRAVFTVEESKKIDKHMLGVFHTKNLFLKDEGNKFFLVSMSADNRLDLKKLKEKLNAKKKLSFASPNQLKDHLNLSPGSVSIFGMINAKHVKLILDKGVWNAKKVSFHPNINTATLELSHEDLEKFYNSIKTEKIIMDLN